MTACWHRRGHVSVAGAVSYREAPVGQCGDRLSSEQASSAAAGPATSVLVALFASLCAPGNGFVFLKANLYFEVLLFWDWETTETSVSVVRIFFFFSEFLFI